MKEMHFPAFFFTLLVVSLQLTTETSSQFVSEGDLTGRLNETSVGDGSNQDGFFVQLYNKLFGTAHQNSLKPIGNQKKVQNPTPNNISVTTKRYENLTDTDGGLSDEIDDSGSNELDDEVSDEIDYVKLDEIDNDSNDIVIL